MKKFFMSSIVLIIFSISILLFQLSCQKSTDAQTGTQPSSNVILYVLGYSGGAGYNTSYATGGYWIMNYDGSNKHKIQINIPSNYSLNMNPRLSTDGKIVFFTANDPNAGNSYLYSCSVDGSNLKILLQDVRKDGMGADIEIAGTY